jgi:hypothetical protein
MQHECVCGITSMHHVCVRRILVHQDGYTIQRKDFCKDASVVFLERYENGWANVLVHRCGIFGL